MSGFDPEQTSGVPQSLRITRTKKPRVGRLTFQPRHAQSGEQVLEFGFVLVLKGAMPISLPGGELATRKYRHVFLGDAQELLQR